MQGQETEVQTRTELIDSQLARAGWSRSRRSLLEEFGLAVAETEGDYHGQQYADYADAIRTRFGEDPFIFLTNGNEFQFWDRDLYPPRKIAGFYTRDDLERLQHQRRYAKALDQQPRDIEVRG
jgi:type I restriction enzyme R subunit